ncbi:synaptophysin-like protein 1 [Galendromus occidentalis]|uniref:Synaptophysin-like protein 1 n=1 Tax=Galendromus occidentalis TaxID=34638 RepID=A0AAJ6QUS3_9ACAR|nr:synaptophysin-like protein 1 [Galendromus occidentalis]
MERWRAHVANAVEMFTLDLRTLLEPRGFIRVLQVVFAILAFSIACSYKSSSDVTVKCGANSKTWTVESTYPFSPELLDFDPPEGCLDPRMIRVPSMACGVQGKAEFFVTVGVLSLFVCLVTLPVYLCKTEYYENNTWLPLLDFGVTAVMTSLWFVSSCVWSDAVSSIKRYSDPTSLAKLIPACTAGADCGPIHEAKYTSLNIAAILGFTNIILWAGSSWFVYKETSLHSQPPQETPNSPQRPRPASSNPPSQQAPPKPPTPTMTAQY